MDTALAALSTEEIQQFITNGFLVKRKILDPKLCAAARDRLWAGNSSSHLRRGDPKTWVNGIPESDRQSTPDGMNDRTGDCAWRLRELSGDEDMIDLLPRRVFPWFEQLFGEVVTPEVSSSAPDPDPRGSRLRGWPVWGGKELRGIYCVLPKERTSSSPSMADAARAGAHIDPEPMHLVVSVLPLSNTVYAFNASRTRFFPYQNNPLLKFLDSANHRLLISGVGSIAGLRST